jgi:dihydroneopterin aldolase
MAPFAAGASGLDVLSIHDLEVRCIVGLYARERDLPQPLLVDVDLEIDTRTAARTESLAATVDYGRAAGELRFLLESCRFRLLETAAEALARWLLAPASAERPRPRVERARVRLTKPEALGGGARASLEILRRAGEATYAHEATAWGAIEVIHVGRDCGIYRLHVAPGRSIPTHVRRAGDEPDLFLRDRLLLQRRPVLPGTGFHWPNDLPHRYDNESDVEQTILRVDRPPSAPRDERLVDDPPAGLVLPPSTSYAPAAALG